MQVTVFVYIFVSCSQITTARQWAGSRVYTMYKPVSTEEMFSAAKYFKYIPDHVWLRKRFSKLVEDWKYKSEVFGTILKRNSILTF